ncbi:hypothetical protein PGB34_18405 [Xenophilus arseniciresistens]|uniref:Uncharacterized protein n=1 Tax=Xenophilus arseniciresistens TaxID=1283306 RepID=A0AAE3NC02_9BURK|nr:hypothetical protein [Xenophilus arseniciresistens]MDA7418344.1 hypothetical protein [Xenophilus arseniciresistens]
MKAPVFFAALALAGAFTLPARADSLTASASSAGSSASSAGSASSDSISSSSNSSSGADKTAAIKDGDWRVTAVAPVPDQAGNKLRLSLEPQGIAQARPFTLDVPLKALGGQAPAVGDIVQSRQRVYGVQFTRAAAPEPFLLVLADSWDQQLRSRPVTP